MVASTAVPLHLGEGGPFSRLEARSRLGLPGRIIACIAITWVPFMVLAGVASVVNRTLDPLLFELGVHARFLITLPLLLVAERVLDTASGTAAREVFRRGLLPRASEERVRSVVARVERTCNSPWPEVVLLAVAFGISLVGWFGLLHRLGAPQLAQREGPAGAWLSLVSVPLLQFLFLRQLFRWALWMRVLIAIAIVRLEMHPTHPDCCGGLAFLKLPSIAYGALLAVATNATLAGGLGTQVLLHDAKLETYAPLFVVVILVVVAFVFGPLVLFVPKLSLARQRARQEFGELINDYSTRFEQRWMARESDDELLGTADVQSLSDFGSVYRETVTKIQPLLFGVRDLVVVIAVGLLPVVPLLLTKVPFRELVAQLIKVLA